MTEIIIALDYSVRDEALALVDRLGPAGTFYKVGLELFTHAGPSVVEELSARGKRVFLDLKLHDIPNTVAGAVRAAAALDVDLLTVHGSGGRRMLEAARDAADGRLGILAVTVLTSLTPAEMESVWGREIVSVRDEVARLADLASDVGVSGVVASALETSWLRRAVREDFLIVTPGIRPAGGDRADQRRVATPADAVEAGADYLVIGRPITRAVDPRSALEAILAEIAAASAPDA
jgi:orotidine-5'-phosphate decarboxylase